ELVMVITKPRGRIVYNVKPSDWAGMHDPMEQTVNAGTAGVIYTPRYRIAGKTGTAQVKSIAQGKSYNKAALDKRHWDHAWFTGFAPVEDPQIAVAVLVENGGGGSSTAAPIGRALFDYWMLRRPNNPLVPPSPEELEVIRAEKAAAKALLDAEREAQEALEKEAEEAEANKPETSSET